MLLNPSEYKNIKNRLGKISYENILEEAPLIKKEFKKRLSKILKKIPDESMVMDFLSLDRDITIFNNILETMSFIKASPDMIDALEKVSSFSYSVKDDEAIYNALKNFQTYAPSKDIKAVVQKIIKKYDKAGIGLDLISKKELKKLDLTINKKALKFMNNLTEEEEAFNLYLPSWLTIGINASTLSKLKKDGKSYIVRYGDVLDVICESDNPYIRENLSFHLSFVGSNNYKLMPILLKSRYKKATLLGYNSYSHMFLDGSMAKTPSNVKEFLTNINQKVRGEFEKHLQDLKNYYGELFSFNQDHFPYFHNRFMKEVFAFDKEEVKNYLSFDGVLNAVFKMTEKMFDLKIVEKKDLNRDEIWHESVRCFEVYSDENKDFLGTIYLDPFVRQHKASGGWTIPLIDRSSHNSEEKIDTVSIVGLDINVSEGEGDVLLSIDDASTIFHEFGHAFQHLLSTHRIAFLSNLSSMEEDAGEIASMFYEELFYDESNLNEMLIHYQTGKKATQQFIKSILNNRYYDKLLYYVRLLKNSFFDLALYSEQNENRMSWIDVEIKETQSIEMTSPLKTRHRCQSFAHGFVDYSSNYYSYLWGEFYAKKLYEEFFKEKSPEDFKDNAHNLKKGFLSQYGLCSSEDFLNLKIREDEA